LEGSLSSENVSLDGLSNFFIDVRKVSTRNTDQPFFAGLTGSSWATSTKTKSLIGLDDDGSHYLNNLNLYARNVGSRSLEEPLVTGIFVLKITYSSQAKGSVRCHDLKWRYLAVQGLSRIEREWLRNFDSDFFVTMTKLNRAVFSDDGVSLLVTNNRVLNNTEVTRRNQKHLSRARNNDFMLLSRKGFRSANDSRHIRIVV